MSTRHPQLDSEAGTDLPDLYDLVIGGHTYRACGIAVAHYGDAEGPIAILVYSAEDGEPIATATVNIVDPMAVLKRGCVWIKDYGENVGIAHSLEQAGLIDRTGREWAAGWAQVDEYRLVGDLRVAAESIGMASAW
jgi:hypothetical protein